MSGLFGNAPEPPNPVTTGAIQTGTNLTSGIENLYLNQTNQQTPYGSLTYSTTGENVIKDPTTGNLYSVPITTATQTLSPTQQNLYNLQTEAQTNLGQTAVDQSKFLQQLLGTPINLGNAPGSASPDWLKTPGATLGYNTAGQQQTTFGDAGDVTRTYGPDDFSADRSKVEEALYQRMDPQLQRDRQAMESRLADQGIQVGSPAYQAAWDQYNRQLTDTRLGITQTAGQEQQRMQQEAQAQAEFQNAAQQQAYQQLLGRGQFANSAQAQQYQQNALAAQFYNAGAAQQYQQNKGIFDAQNQLRNQYLTEQYASRQEPINEISALMAGSQVSRPNFTTTPTSQISSTDIAGLINQNFNQQFANYQQQSNQTSQLLGGIFGALGSVGTGAVLKSDRREKENINKLGTVLATNPDADDRQSRRLPIYQYSYKDDPASTRHIGPMAQDVEKIDPSAVTTRGGVKYINTTRLGSILKVA